MMGDNRDNSMDSRFPAVAGRGIGLVPQDNLVGRASFMLLDRRRGELGQSGGPGSPRRAGSGSETAFERALGRDARPGWKRSAATVRDEALWLEALTHGSTGDGARLRAARIPRRPGARPGDRRWLYQHNGGSEGELAQRLNALVSRAACAASPATSACPTISGSASRRATTAAQDSDNILGDVMEALLGASFLEAGFDATRDVVRAIWGEMSGARRARQASQERAAGMGRRQPPQAARIRAGRPLRPRPRAQFHRAGHGHECRRGRSHGQQQAGRRNRRRRSLHGEIRMSESEPTRCGVVAVIGAPNAGKSTLVNALVGQKVAITCAKAQTTRARLMGIALARRSADHPRRYAGHLRAQPPARPGDGQRRVGRRAGGRRDPAGGRSGQAAPPRAEPLLEALARTGPNARCWCSTRSTRRRRSRCSTWPRT